VAYSLHFARPKSREVQLFTKLFLNSENLQQFIEAPPIPSATSADYNWTVQSLDGRFLNLEELKGKVIFSTSGRLGVRHVLPRCRAFNAYTK